MPDPNSPSSDPRLAPFLAPFAPESVILASHTARAIDHAGNPGLCIAFAPEDDVLERYIGTPPGVTRIISKDKDHQHAFVFRLLLRDELPEHDPFASGEVTAFLTVMRQELDKADAKAILDARQTSDAQPESEAPSDARDASEALRTAQDITNALLQGQVSAEFLALHQRVRDAGKKETSADMGKMNGLMLAARRDPQARQFALDHLERTKGLPFPAPSVPLRQRVKQLVIPGPEQDVVISPLPSLPMLDVIREVAQFIGQEAPYARHRFIGWQSGIGNPQNTGIPLLRGSKAIRHEFRINALHDGFNLRSALSEPASRDALQELYTANRYRRFCRDAQGIQDEKTPSPSKDIDRRLSDAARAVVGAIDEAVDGIVRAAREDITLRDLSADDIAGRLRSAFLTEVGRALQRLYASQAKPAGKKKSARLGLKRAEQEAILCAWDAAWANQQGGLA